MRNFILGCVVGVVLTSLPVFAQLYPYDAPLKERLAAEAMQQELRMQWQLDLEQDPLLEKKPCR